MLFFLKKSNLNPKKIYANFVIFYMSIKKKTKFAYNIS